MPNQDLDRLVGRVQPPPHAQETGSPGDAVLTVLVGMLVVAAGTIPRNLLFRANLHYYASVPWAVPASAVLWWFFWRYLDGAGPPESIAEQCRAGLRANPISAKAWIWSLIAGGLGTRRVGFCPAGRESAGRAAQQGVPDLSHIPRLTLWSLLLTGAPIAGVVEEAAFRGYMQGPIERRYGLAIAILITGTMFALAHLDFTSVLWPYYVAVASIYGSVTYLTNSILPAIVDRPFWFSVIALLFIATAMVWAYVKLPSVARGRGD